MKKDLLTLLCLTLVCASVMLGVMSIYKLTDVNGQKEALLHGKVAESTAFRIETGRRLF